MKKTAERREKKKNKQNSEVHEMDKTAEKKKYEMCKVRKQQIKCKKSETE